MSIESFSVTPLAGVMPSYLYQQYADDVNLAAFVASYNEMTQALLAWVQAPFSVLTSGVVSGTLLDLVGTNLYGIPRPLLATSVTQDAYGINSDALDASAVNAGIQVSAAKSTRATDATYIATILWNVYRGDGCRFTVRWLKNRVARFVAPTVNVLDTFVSVSPDAGTYTITMPSSTAFTALQQVYSGGYLTLPATAKLAFAS